MSDLPFTEPIVIDRSDLERWADCPRAAAFASVSGEPTSKAMASGTEAHAAISSVISELVAIGSMSPTEVAASLTANLRSVRPDLQPDVLEAVPDHIRWSIGRMLAEHHSGDILRFDGGDGDQSGQLARDVTIGETTVRVTSELDLLMATRSPDILAEHDWKTGWTPWTADDVLPSFQFALHWWIVADVYPDATALDVTIWATRHGKRTDRVRFTRRDLPDIEARVMSAIGDWYQFRESSAPHCPARPFAEKCSLCQHSNDCLDAEIVGDDTPPEQLVDRLVVLDAASDAMRKKLWAVRDARGSDIVSPSGNAFGMSKPRRVTKPQDPLYTLTSAQRAAVEGLRPE